MQDKAHVSGDPFKSSGYFRLAERTMAHQWDYFIWPRISGLDRSVVIDLACGHGRNTERLAAVSGRVIALDINQECVEATQKRVAGFSNVEVRRIDGSSLEGVPDASVSLVYCWDAMVHFEHDVVALYVKEFARVLRPGGAGFIHHSNWTGGRGTDFRTQPHWRNYMSREIFRDLLQSAGLAVVSQDVIDWDESRRGRAADAVRRPRALVARALKPLRRRHGYTLDLDCISVFRKP